MSSIGLHQSLAFCALFVYNVVIMKRLSVLFYIFIGILTPALIVTLALWINFKSSAYLYVTLAEFAVYIGGVAAYLIHCAIESQTNETLKCAFLMLLQNYETKIVYITYIGNERRLKRPSKFKRDYLVEFYPRETDVEMLKKHLWFGLPKNEEAQLKNLLIGGLDVPYPLLKDISQKQVLLQARFQEAVSGLPHFEFLLNRNEIILYGEEGETND